MTQDELKTALAVLNWSRERLAAWSVVPIEVVREIEQGRPVEPRHLAAIRTTLADAGLIFTDSEAPEVRLRSTEQ